MFSCKSFLGKTLLVPSSRFVRLRGNKPAIMSQWNSSTQSNIPTYTSLLPSSYIAQTPRRPSLLRAMWGVSPSSPQPPPLPHPHTHPSSHPLGTYLSVAFIHNPRDLNLFPPHRPRLFLSLLSLKNFMPFSSLSSVFFFFLFSLLLSLYLPFFFSAFYLFQSTQRFQHPYLQEKKNEGGGGEDEH